jgi:excisionase family DNA binding protein
MISDPHSLPLLLTPDEAASLLRISRAAMYARIARRQVPGIYRDGRRVRIVRDLLLRSIERGVTR